MKGLSYPLGSGGFYLRITPYMKWLLWLVYFYEGQSNPMGFLSGEHKGDTGCSRKEGKAELKPKSQILVS